MYFLVDFENVLSDGLRGAQYLKADDTVIIFYSQVCDKVQQGVIRQIMDSACHLDICKLQKQGKNALDFYIASKLGELTGQGQEGTAVIISNDSGFQAVRDYWEKRAARKRRVLVSPSIEDGIISGNENNERTAELRRLRQKLGIGAYYSNYKEEKRIRTVLQKLFEGTEFESRIEEIQNMIEGKEKSAKIIYLSSLRLFGRKNGLEVYNTIKSSGELQRVKSI